MHIGDACQKTSRLRGITLSSFIHILEITTAMVEKTHTYFVHDVPYQYSVSDVWKVFFDDFDSSKTALFVLDRAKTRGLQNILSSVYNLYMFFVMLKHLHPRSSQFWDALEGLRFS